MTADAAREHVLAEHAAVVETVVDCADAVAAGWDGDSTPDREAVVPPLRATLDRAGVLDRLPGVLAGAVSAAGHDLAAPPVAAPPYVAVASRGPVLRATVGDRRLVVTLAVFGIDRDGTGGGDGVRYRRTGETPDEVVAVESR